MRMGPLSTASLTAKELTKRADRIRFGMIDEFNDQVRDGYRRVMLMVRAGERCAAAELVQKRRAARWFYRVCEPQL